MSSSLIVALRCFFHLIDIHELLNFTGYSGLNCSEWVSVSGDSALCVCPQNFSAVDLCNDTYPVVPSPCQNDGTCTLILTEDGVLQPNCTCQPGYEGPDCDAVRLPVY